MLKEKLKAYKIILASQSPRRQQLLKGLDIDFEVFVKKDIKENYPENLKGKGIVKFLAQQKATAYKNQLKQNSLFITADTIVCMYGEILEKPKNRADAIEMIKRLSGKVHTVYTGVCIFTSEKEKTFVAETKVFFKTLSEEEIEYYVDNYKPYDKAGAYGIQEWIGYTGIEKIEGSYFNVMGLPVQKLYEELKSFCL